MKCGWGWWMPLPGLAPKTYTRSLFVHLLVGCKGAGELRSPRWHQNHKVEGSWVPGWLHGAECLIPHHTPIITGQWCEWILNFVLLNHWELEPTCYSGYHTDCYRAEAEKSWCCERGQGYLVPSQVFPIEVSRSADKSTYISSGTGADDPTGLL